MNLTGTVTGAYVTYYKNLRPRTRDTGRDLVLFGIQHQNHQRYLELNRGNDQSYVPNWISALVQSSANIERTAIVLEHPPYIPAGVLGKEPTARVVGDPILWHTMEKIRTQFDANGAAAGNGWSVIGTDLRGKFRWKDGDLHRISDNIRDTIHRVDRSYLDGDTWTQSFITNYNYYWYLIARTNSSAGFDAMVNEFCQHAVTDPTPEGIQRQVWAQSAAICRDLYGQGRVPGDLSAKIILHLISETGAIEGMPSPPSSDAVSSIAEQLVNLGLLGYIFSTAINAKNVVVAIGNAHVRTVKAFLAGHKSLVTWDGLVEGTEIPGPPRQSTLNGIIQIT